MGANLKPLRHQAFPSGIPRHIPAPVRPRSKRNYDRPWRALRLEILRQRETCEALGCEERAAEVDHIVPLTAGGKTKWSNLQALCPRCHRRKTAQEDGAFGNPRKARTKI